MKNLVFSQEFKKVQPEITEYLFPVDIYLPVKRNAKILMKKKKIKKNDPLYIQNNKTVFSPVSGTLKSIESKKDYLNKTCVYMHIRNDFQENVKNLMKTTTIFFKDIQEQLKMHHTFFQKNFQNSKSLILCGIEQEPFIFNKTFIHKYHKDELLLFLDAISSAFNIEDVRIYLSERDTESIQAFLQIINIYPNIKIHLLKDIYPLGNLTYFKKYLKLTDQDKVLNTEKLFQLYFELIKQKKQDFIYVTFNGDAISHPKVLKVKIGTSLLEIIEEVLEITGPYNLYINGIISGVKAEAQNVFLTEEIKAVFFMKKIVIKDTTCNSCGKCNEVCPISCNPYKSVLSKGKITQKECLSCGLCEYICPKYIKIREYTKGGLK